MILTVNATIMNRPGPRYTFQLSVLILSNRPFLPPANNVVYQRHYIRRHGIHVEGHCVYYLDYTPHCLGGRGRHLAGIVAYCPGLGQR